MRLLGSQRVVLQFLSLAIFVVLLVTMSGCTLFGRKVTPTTPLTYPWLDLTSGSQWTYQVSDPSVGSYTEDYTVVGLETFNNESATKVAHKTSLTTSTTTEYDFYKEGSGSILHLGKTIWQTTEKPDSTTTYTPNTAKAYPINLKVGDTFHQIFTSTTNDATGTKEEKKDFTFVVLAEEEFISSIGPVKTLKISMVDNAAAAAGTTSKATIWLIANGIGIVKFSSEIIDKQGTTISKVNKHLLWYTLK